MIINVLAAIAAYLIGSINFSIILSKLIGGKDIRTSGSGNAGATNMLRTYGKKMGVITLLLDVFKGIAVILICRLLKIDTGWEYIAGVCVILGHNFPIYFGFKGGKGVATSLGVVIMMDWQTGIIVAVIAVTVMAATRYVSLGSIIGAVSLIVCEIIKMAAVHSFDVIKLICIVIIGGLLIVRHHANIGRLIKGTENKLGSKK